MIDVSICVCTYRRPPGLLRLLRSLARLDPASPRYEVIVVDNDAEGSGEASVRQAREEGIEVQYLVEPERGIARARNRSVAPARGTFIAFIDDDEEADPRWLVEMFTEVARHGADAGIGPVLPRFPDRAPPWATEGKFYDRPRPRTGKVLAHHGMRTGNALVRRQLLNALDGPFDVRFALTGGEDTDLFMRLGKVGCRVIAVDSAIVHEHLSPNRTTASWLLRRRFLIGLGTARVYAAETPGVRPGRQLVRWLASGLGVGALGLLVYPASRVAGLTRLTLAARYLGRSAFYGGFTYHPYARDSWR